MLSKYYRFRIRNFCIGLAPGLFSIVERYYFAFMHAKDIQEKGLRVPLPGFLKRAVIKGYLKDHGCEVMVETGTYQGDTPWHFRNCCKEIYTIEVDRKLAELARRRFRRFPSIRVLEGDSGKVLEDVCPTLTSPTLFWLDAHYSGGITGFGETDCPILAELSAVVRFTRVDYCILIDDARCFGTFMNYPTLDDLITVVGRLDPKLRVNVENDIIMISL